MTDPISDLQGLAFSSSSSYTIVEEIGRGGMGIVFLAEKDAEGVVDHVVLKTIKTLSKKHEEKLKREANISTQLRHENIVKTYGLEAIPYAKLPDSFRKEVDGLRPEQARRRHLEPLSRRGDMLAQLRRRRMTAMRRPQAVQDDRKLLLMVMDYVEGTDLRTLHKEHLRKKRLLPCPLAAFVVSRMCRALSYAHKLIIHRDISPENILINTQGVAKLSDFGVAVDAGAPTEAFAGKLGYMSPEQLRSEQLDARSDIYSLGLVLYHTLTGVPIQHPPARLPFTGKLAAAITAAQTDPPAPHEVRPDVPKILSKICMQMIARDPHNRMPRAEDAGDLLEMKYLYAEGFGPTNNSLAAYLKLLGRDFKDPTKDELRQLHFLKGPDGKIRLQRTAKPEDYSETGRALIDKHQGTVIHRLMTR